MSTSTAFGDIGYRVEDVREGEDVHFLPGSVGARPFGRPRSVAHIRATPTGDAALERIYRLLRDRRAGRGR
ncbi:hypothetical protein A8D62_10105 [Burkholderia cenocepacia]|uniref:hypothetical protein n=1 Tax=Burkholderia TaxID=32008 RepID=UPI00098113FB|nr:hypothetical protein [Burkholderia cenocepacia]ONN91533.1 hypothetical protein A8D63_11300 [Burkholderia cenocepacia]ONN94779.1 hypothetical protein A8D62_10105 [Burkholderia cenocepacia]